MSAGQPKRRIGPRCLSLGKPDIAGHPRGGAAITFRGREVRGNWDLRLPERRQRRNVRVFVLFAISLSVGVLFYNLVNPLLSSYKLEVQQLAFTPTLILSEFLLSWLGVVGCTVAVRRTCFGVRPALLCKQGLPPCLPYRDLTIPSYADHPDLFGDLLFLSYHVS
ncbi:hypothetical protein B0J18DRAFT_34685 [Chaetomium sp. MPI-SDFR-AT-0129]|nr:hypothetical protein B0J18DRAFT_34685 [Chaetomium sp. MPI-SDFR-AT-0129]